MALVKCPDCGKDVSDKAKSCIHCGCPIWQAENKRDTDHISKRFYIVVLIVAVLLIFALVIFFLGKTYYSKVFTTNMDTEESSEYVVDIDSVDKSVVTIICNDQSHNTTATGSGFIAFDSHTVVTNYHVACEGFFLYVQDRDENQYRVLEIVYADEVYDLAILRVSEDIGNPVILGDSNQCEKGEEVWTIGAPLGLSNTLSEGIISGFQKNEEMNGANIIQTSAPISPGSSGGVLLNAKNEVIGVTYAGLEGGQNINFAIPINIVKAAFEEITENETKTSSAELYYSKYPYLDRTKYYTVEGYLDENWAGDTTIILYSSIGNESSEFEQWLNDKRGEQGYTISSDSQFIGDSVLYPNAYVRLYLEMGSGSTISFIEVIE